MTNETNKTVDEYRLHYRGLFGRNRTVKGGSVLLADMPHNSIVHDDVLQVKVDAVVAALKAKPGLRYQVVLTEVTVESGGAFTSRSFLMFSGKKVLEGVVA